MEFNLGKVAPSWKGAYSSSTTYSKLDIVQYNGSSWISKIDSNTNHTPAEGTYWAMIARAGQWNSWDAQTRQQAVDEVIETIELEGELNIHLITTDTLIVDGYNVYQQLYSHNQAISGLTSYANTINNKVQGISYVDRKTNIDGFKCTNDAEIEGMLDVTDEVRASGYIWRKDANTNVNICDAVQNAVDAISQVSQHTNRLNALEEEMHTTTVKEIETRVSDLEGDFDEVKNNIRNLNTRVNDLEDDVETIKNEVNDPNLLVRTTGLQVYLSGTLQKYLGKINVMPGEVIYATREGGATDSGTEVTLYYTIDATHSCNEGNTIEVGKFTKILDTNTSYYASYSKLGADMYMFSDNDHDTGIITLFIK